MEIIKKYIKSALAAVAAIGAAAGAAINEYLPLIQGLLSKFQ